MTRRTNVENVKIAVGMASRRHAGKAARRKPTHPIQRGASGRPSIDPARAREALGIRAGAEVGDKLAAPVLQAKAPKVFISPTSELRVAGSPRRILIVYSYKGWVLEKIAFRLANVLKISNAIVSACPMQEVPSNLVNYDTVVLVWWKAISSVITKVRPGTAIYTMVYDHFTWKPAAWIGKFVAALSRSSKVFASNRALVEEVSHLTDTPVEYLSDGVDTGVFTPADPPRVSSLPLAIGWAGNSRAVKHLDILTSAVAQVPEVTLSIVDKARPATYIRPNRMPEWYRTLDAIACTSYSEGTPNPILEGAACGLPFVSTIVGIVPELYSQTGGGFLIESHNTNAVVDALRRLVANRNELNNMGRRNREAAETYWAWDGKFDALVSSIFASAPPLSEETVVLPSQPSQMIWPSRTQALPVPVIQPPKVTAVSSLSLAPYPGEYERKGEETTVLMACTQAPGWGGAATSFYEALKGLRVLGLHCVGLFINDWDRLPTKPGATNSWLDPDSVGGVVAADYPRRGTKLGIKGYEPDVILGKNYKAPQIVAKGRAPMVYVTSSINSISSRDLDPSLIGDSLFSRECQDIRAFESSDYVIVHSDMDYSIYRKYLPSKLFDKIVGEPIPLPDITVRVTTEEGVPYSERKYDLCFIASKWDRVIKNGRAVKELAREFSQSRIAVVGVIQGLESVNVDTYGLVSHKDAVDILANSRVLVIPSMYDSAPGVYAEAIVAGCNVVCGPNVGNTKNHPENLRSCSAKVTDLREPVKEALGLSRQLAYRKIGPDLALKALRNRITTIRQKWVNR